jgi:hypothetical protein
VVHKKSNALQITFHDAEGDPFAVGVQGAGAGKGKKIGVLFGFKNGGTGNHQLTFADGRVLGVASKDGAPSDFSDQQGSHIATVARGETSAAVLANGTNLFQFTGDPEDGKTVELFRLLITTGAGEQVGRLDVIRKDTGWTISRAVDAAWDDYIWWDHAGRALPIPILGTRLTLTRPVVGIERDVLLCACVDMAIGLRPYAACMA